MVRKIILVLLIIAIIFFVSFPFIKRIVLKNNYIKIYGRNAKRIAHKNSLVILSGISLADINGEANVDHIIFGNKFVYLISDFYFDGIISGDNKSNSWIFINQFVKNAKYISNLYAKGNDKICNFSRLAKIDEKVLVHLSVMNGGCDLRIEKNSQENSLVIKTRELSKIIKQFEKENVKDFDKEQLKVVINEIIEKNGKEK